MWRQQRWISPQEWWTPSPYHGHFPGSPIHEWDYGTYYGYPWATGPGSPPQLRRVGMGEPVPRNAEATGRKMPPDPFRKDRRDEWSLERAGSAPVSRSGEVEDVSPIWESPESPESPWLRE